MSEYSSTKHASSGIRTYAARLRPEAMAHGPPAEPPAVLGEVVERDPELSPVDQLERQVMEVRIALPDQRDRVVVGVECSHTPSSPSRSVTRMPSTSQ